jgi:hypothetical protein
LLAGSFIRGAKIAAREESRIVRRTMLQQEAMIERVRRAPVRKTNASRRR